MRISTLASLPMLTACLAVACVKPAPKDEGAKSTLSALEADCEKGNTVACLKAGSAYYQGRLVKQSFPRAAALFTKACSKGSGDGCFHLANMLELGRGVKQDLAAALRRYTEACKHKVGPGCYRLGKYYHQGESGQAADFVRGVAFFKKACDIPGKYQGESCFFVGNAFGGGKGVPRSLTQCATFMNKSCKLGDRNGCAGLAALYEKGLGGLKQDLVEARRLYQKACSDGVLAACTAVKQLDKRPAPMARPAMPAMRPAAMPRLRPM